MDLFHTADRNEWRAWLERNHRTASEIWFVSPKRHTGEPRLPYNDAVEEALCFGWIDSQTKSIDADHTAQRFSPRKASGYSQPNIERLRKLAAEGKLMPEVAAQVDDLLNRPFVFPPDILKALKANKKAWQHYRRFSLAYQRIRVAWIEAARDRPAEFRKRLRHFVAQCEQNKQFGYGGVDVHY
jgi:uncharacterized protein YdeI (YjbR/CyaY-like superfamily)